MPRAGIEPARPIRSQDFKSWLLSFIPYCFVVFCGVLLGEATTSVRLDADYPHTFIHVVVRLVVSDLKPEPRPCD